MAGTFHFKGTQAVEQGATGIWEFVVYTGDTVTVGQELNLTGYLVRMQVRETPEDTDIIFQADSSGIGGIVIVAAAGKFTLTISATATAALVAGTYVYQIELVNGSGAVQRLLAGDFIVSAEVVR